MIPRTRRNNPGMHPHSTLHTYMCLRAWGGLYIPTDTMVRVIVTCVVRYSLAGQDTRPSPERPGFESQWRNIMTHISG